MTGCFDNSVGDVEAEDNSSGGGENSEVIEIPSVFTVHIAQGQTETITLNGTTLRLMDAYNNNNGYWQNSGTSVGISMDCANGFSMVTYVYSGPSYDNPFLPNLPDIECELELNYQSQNSETVASEKILIFSEAELKSLT